MPRGRPRKLFPSEYKATAPVTEIQATDQITNILAPGSEEDFVKSLPENTAVSTEEAPPRKKYQRKPKTIDAATGEIDPLMSDPRYQKAIGNMSGLGGARFVKVGFSVSGKPLENDEESEIDDLFYVIGKRSKLDPGASWFVLGLYSLFLLCRLIVVRTDAGDQLKKFFEPKKEEEKEKA